MNGWVISMNKRLLFLGILCVIAALAIFAFAQRYFGQVEQAAQEQFLEERNVQQVLVYSRSLARGTKIQLSDLTWQERIGDNIPSWAVIDTGTTDLNFYREQFLLRDVDEGDYVSLDHMLRGSAGYMSLAIRPNLRAFAIPTSEVQLAGGFVEPDDRVDIVHTVVRDLDGDGRQNGITDFIIRNVRVLAVGSEALTGQVAQTSDQQQAQVSGPDTIEAETVTLELTEEQIVRLSSAMTTGTVTLALRPVSNNPMSASPTMGGSATIDSEYIASESNVATTDTGEDDAGVIGVVARPNDGRPTIRIISNTSVRQQVIE